MHLQKRGSAVTSNRLGVVTTPANLLLTTDDPLYLLKMLFIFSQQLECTVGLTMVEVALVVLDHAEPDEPAK